MVSDKEAENSRENLRVQVTHYSRLPGRKQRKVRLVEKYIYVVIATSRCLLYDEGYQFVEATIEICVNLLCI